MGLGTVEVMPTRPQSAPPTAAAAQDVGMEYAAPSPQPATRQRDTEFEVPPAPLGLVALHNLWTKTKGTLSLDLKRKQFKASGPGDSLWRISNRGRPPSRPQPAYGAPPGAYAAGRAGYGSSGSSGSSAVGLGSDMFPSLSFMDTGARIKAMRHIQFGPTFEVERPSGLRRELPAFDLGVGLSFELDTAELQPQARLKFRDILSLKALPYPAIKLQKRLALGDSSWGVRLSYECPLDSLNAFYQSPARVMLTIDNMRTNGVQLTQAGVEFNYAADLFEGSTQLRAAGLVALPRELPVVEGQPLVGLELRRLGLKAGW